LLPIPGRAAELKTATRALVKQLVPLNGAFAAAGLAIWAHVAALKVSTTPRARLAARGTAVFIVLQIILGIGNLMMKAPFGMSLAHLVTGLTLFALLVILTYEIRFRYETQPARYEAPVS